MTSPWTVRAVCADDAAIIALPRYYCATPARRAMRVTPTTIEKPCSR